MMSKIFGKNGLKNIRIDRLYSEFVVYSIVGLHFKTFKTFEVGRYLKTKWSNCLVQKRLLFHPIWTRFNGYRRNLAMKSHNGIGSNCCPPWAITPGCLPMSIIINMQWSWKKENQFPVLAFGDFLKVPGKLSPLVLYHPINIMVMQRRWFPLSRITYWEWVDLPHVPQMKPTLPCLLLQQVSDFDLFHQMRYGGIIRSYLISSL